MIETQQVNAEFAVASTGDNFAQMFYYCGIIYGLDSIYNCGELNWNPSFQFASLSSDLANRLHK